MQNRPLLNKNTDHFRKFAGLACKISIKNLQRIIPVAKQQIFKADQENEHLNNIALSLWDKQHYYVRRIAQNTARTHFWSLSMTVCVLKHVAINNYMESKNA